jgi:hypothetical protein
MERDGGLQVFQLLAESVGQAGKSARMLMRMVKF